MQAHQAIPELLNIIETCDREYGYLPPETFEESSTRSFKLYTMDLQQKIGNSSCSCEEQDSSDNHADSENLQDSDYWLLAREEFIHVLSQLSGHVETIPILVAELTNGVTTFDLRYRVAKALGKMRAVEAIPTLLAIIQQKHPFPSVPPALAAHTLEEIDMGKPF